MTNVCFHASNILDFSDHSFVLIVVTEEVSQVESCLLTTVYIDSFLAVSQIYGHIYQVIFTVYLPESIISCYFDQNIISLCDNPNK